MNSVAGDLLSIVSRISAAMSLPPVRGLLLPVVGEKRTKDAEFCALELEDGSIGLGYVWLGETLAVMKDRPPGETLAGMDVVQLAAWYDAPDPARRTLGLAAINAVSQCFFRAVGFVPDSASDSIGLVEPSMADHIGMIGLFPPLVERIRSTGARLTVAELNPALVEDGDRYRVTLDLAELSSCNKVLSTATILLNDTLDAVIAACRDASHFGIIGPSAGCIPDPLFARGVDLFGGTAITRPAEFRSAMQRGDSWGGFARKYCIRRSDYPGFGALLARL